VFAAPVAGATVVILNSSGTATLAGPVTTLSDGSYRIDIPNTALTSDLIISATSGTFTDEATATDVSAGTLAAYIPGGSLTAGSAVHLDPSSTIVHDLVTSGTCTSVACAETLFNSAFGYTPDASIAPMNTAANGTNAPNRLAALRAGAFSQLAKDLGISPDKQFDLIRAIAHDLADDGLLNGSAGPVNGTGIPEDIQNKFEQALVSFMTNTTCNHTGLTAAEIGSLPFAKVVLTNTYRVEYVPGMMAATVGKTSFKIRVTDRIGGTPVTGLTLKLMPLMHMATMSHATPVDTVVESATAGTYNCTAYYLMASGPGMGFWELKVLVGGMMGEPATFYPPVGMAMGSTTVRATLKGQATDIISSMTGTEKRSYYLFKDGLVTASTTTFDLFIAAKQSMMSYPAVSTSTVLSSPTGTITSMTVDASTDGGSNWVPAVDNTNGHWSVSGLSGLISGTTGTIIVKMTVNGEDKTTDGNAVSGANGYATFVVTP
jgi:hypothetical protein